MIDFNFILRTHKEIKKIVINENLTINEIKDRFSTLLIGNVYTYAFYKRLEESFLIQFNLSNQKIYKEIYENLNFILSNFDHNFMFNENLENFVSTYRLCIYAKNKNFFQTDHIHIPKKKLNAYQNHYYFLSLKGLMIYLRMVK